MLAIAKQLFAEKGYEATTTSAIARGAGTSESQLIKHFGGEEGLLLAILDEGWKQLEPRFAELEKLGSSCEKFASLPKLVLTGLEQDPALLDLLLFEGRRMRKNEGSVLLSGGFQQLVQLADKLLEEMRNSGDLAADVEPQAARSALFGALEGLVRDRMLARRFGYPADYSDAQIQRVFGLLFSAMCTEQSRKRMEHEQSAA
ncbi:MAG: TetR/AcrR family transcriptional regulator [Acidobacteriales bacterium]|nr:TetR/AcrR family transcriptional regulator [Terriglobales bacterium]